MQDFRSSSSEGWWTERTELIAIPSPSCLLCPHFLEVLAWEKSRYCSMMVMVMVLPTTEVQRVLRWRDQSLSWTKSSLSCKKGARDIMSDSAETMPRQRGKPTRWFVSFASPFPGKEIERPIHKGRLQGEFIIAKESVTEQLQKTHCDKRSETHL